jgi:hypothetical protein
MRTPIIACCVLLIAGCHRRVASTDAKPAAKAESAPKRSSSGAFFGAMAPYQSLETVPFAQAPLPPGGPGWYCFEARTTKHEAARRPEVTTSSACFRTLADCRRGGENEMHRAVGSSRDFVEHDVGTCAKQAEAWCMYLWRGADGVHQCFAAQPDCQPFMFSGGATKQSECGVAK